MPEAKSVSRLQLARDEVDRVFGEGYAAYPSAIIAVILRVIHPSSQLRFARVIARWPSEEADKDHDDGTQSEATEAAQQAGHVRYDHGRFLKLCCFARLVPSPKQTARPCMWDRDAADAI